MQQGFSFIFVFEYCDKITIVGILLLSNKPIFSFNNDLFAATYIFNSLIALALGRPLNLEKAAEGEKILIASLAKIESFWLRDDGPFLLGNSQPSIADLSLACEVMQLEVTTKHSRHWLNTQSLNFLAKFQVVIKIFSLSLVDFRFRSG